MNLHQSCRCSENAAIENGRCSVAYLEQLAEPKQMHTHNCLELYYCLSGGRHFVIDDTVYPIHDGDLFLINQFEAHRPEPAPDRPHKRYVLSIMPRFLAELSSPATDLLACFYQRDEFPRRLSLTAGQRKKLLELLIKLSEIHGFGSDLLEQATLTEIILLVMQMSRAISADVLIPDDRRISDILNHIDRSIDQDLSLQSIADAFYMSKGHLCRLFKEYTCTTVNKYVFAKRISRAKQLLTTGANVQETLHKTGFNDYANFIRRFKEEVGISPKQYAKQYCGVGTGDIQGRCP